MRFRQRLILLAALILTLVPGGVALAADEGLRLALGRTTDTTPIEVRVDGRLFVIPHNYFIYPPRRDGKEDDGFLLEVLLPELEPYTAENAEEFRRGGFGRKMRLMLDGGQKVRPLEDLFTLNSEGSSPIPATETTFGLMRGKHRWGADVFAYKDSETVTSYMYCPPPSFLKSSSQKSPIHCVHRFKWNNYDIRLSYSYTSLKDWAKIKNKTVAFLSQSLRP